MPSLSPLPQVDFDIAPEQKPVLREKFNALFQVRWLMHNPCHYE
jgi:hypothetical protein